MGRKRPRLFGAHSRNGDAAELAGRLAPPEELAAAAYADDAMKIGAGEPKTPKGLSEDAEGRGAFRPHPVVIVVLTLFVAYTLFVA